MRFLKRGLFSLLIFLVPTFSFSDVGLGGSFSYGASTSPFMAASFTARSDLSPWSVFFNAHLEDNTISVFLDDWFVNERFAEHLDYYVLWGLSFGARFDDGKTEVFTGSRFGAGLDFFFFNRHFEIFTQGLWNPYLGVKKNSGEGAKFLFRPVNFPLTAGARIWF